VEVEPGVVGVEVTLQLEGREDHLTGLGGGRLEAKGERIGGTEEAKGERVLGVGLGGCKEIGEGEGIEGDQAGRFDGGGGPFGGAIDEDRAGAEGGVGGV
jgi:hypothetical protein